jgi:hypothetical protein
MLVFFRAYSKLSEAIVREIHPGIGKQHCKRSDMELSSLEKSVRIPKNIIFQEVGQEVVLLDMDAGRYYALNSVGSRIWKLLVEKKELLATFESILDEYEVTGETLQPDILRLVQELQTKGLVELEEI